MASARQYKNPPIEEAVCELKFSSPDWDITWPSRLIDRTKNEYTGKPRIQQQSIVSIEPGSGLTIRPESQTTQIVSADGKRLLGISPGTFSVHELKPYSGWAAFNARILSSVQALASLTNEITVHRIGIRYINRIAVPEESAELSSFFTCIPEKAGNLPEAIVNFFARVDFAYPQEDSIIRVTFANGDSSDQELIIMLDIDAIWENNDSPIVLGGLSQSLKVFDEKLSALRDREREVFEGLITDKTREVFDAEVSTIQKS
ncbi:MAG: TIGR04255 family protein [Candidatus Melainabacteria bacterium]|nr:TIGR04255 family protein [Candidatus Melainabacteria bacterium]